MIDCQTSQLSLTIVPVRNYLTPLFAILLFCSVAAAQASVPDDGNVKDGAYSNAFFGFRYAFPKDWVVHGEATKERIKEMGKQRVTDSHVLSNGSAEVMLKHTYQLLTVFQYELGTPGVQDNPAVQIVAEDVRHAPAITNGRIYLLNVRSVLTGMGARLLQSEPVAVDFGGQKFFRQDLEQTISGKSIHSAMIVGFSKGYVLAFVFTATTQEVVDEIAKTMTSLNFEASR
jgi:hypothetical protein